MYLDGAHAGVAQALGEYDLELAAQLVDIALTQGPAP